MAETRSDWATSLLLQTGLPSHQSINPSSVCEDDGGLCLSISSFREQAVLGNGDQLTPGSADRAGRY